MPIKFRVLGGSVGVFCKGGWKCQFYFYGRGDFSDKLRLELDKEVRMR